MRLKTGLVVSSILFSCVSLGLDCKKNPVSPPPETINAPMTLTGPSSGSTNVNLTFITGGSTSTQGHAVEYQFEWGDGSHSNWTSLTSASHPWSTAGTFTVKSHARCISHNDIVSGWSTRSVTIVQPETITAPTTLTGPSSGNTGDLLSFNTSGSVSSLGHAIQYQFDWGDGVQSSWSSATTASHAWSSAGTFTVKSHARCVTHTSIVSGWSSRSITMIPTETITAPTILSGPNSGNTNVSLAFTTGGSVSSLIHSLEYQFDWGDGNLSSWSSATTASHSWSSAGSFTVKSHARCATHTNVISGWSSRTLTVTQPSEIIITPNSPSGPDSAATGDYLPYTTGGSTSNFGHSLQYRFEWGDGSYSLWSSSTSASHYWDTEGTKYIRAQARCATDTSIISNWSGAKSLKMTSRETVSMPNAPSGPTSGNVNQNLTFGASGAVSSLGHSLQYRFSWGGNEGYSPWSSSTSASHAWPIVGAYTIRVQARCQTHTDIESYWSDGFIRVTISPTSESISTPNVPSGLTAGEINQSITYVTGGATSSLGHGVQYRMDWGDGSYSTWSSSTTASHLWSIAGSYSVRAQARCVVDQAIESNWSSSLSVTISPPPETISTPTTPSGPVNADIGQYVSYSTGGAVSSLGHSVQYRFDWGDGTYSPWSSSTTASHAWSSPGTYYVWARARCATNTGVESFWSDPLPVIVNPPMQTVYLDISFASGGAKTWVSNKWSALIFRTGGETETAMRDWDDCAGYSFIMTGGYLPGDEWSNFYPSECIACDLGLAIDPSCTSVTVEVTANLENASKGELYVETDVGSLCQWKLAIYETCVMRSVTIPAQCLSFAGRTEISIQHHDLDLLVDYDAAINRVKYTFNGWKVPQMAPLVGNAETVSDKDMK